jgi:hypothetical protein
MTGALAPSSYLVFYKTAPGIFLYSVYFLTFLQPSQTGSPRPDLLGNVESDEELCDVLIGRLPR